MNPVLELRWKIAMLRLTRDGSKMHIDTDAFNNANAVIGDLNIELATLERFHAESLADGERQARRDREKAG